MSEVLRRAELLAWVRADGRALVVARPNFGQEPRYDLRLDPGGRSSALEIEVTESIESGFRAVTCVGSSRVPKRSRLAYGGSLRRGATVTDDAYPLSDIRCLVIEEARTLADAERMAQAYLDDERSRQRVITVTAPGHGQAKRLYAPDTTARVADARFGLAETLYVVSVTYSGDRSVETTNLELVPLDTRIVMP